MRKRLFPLFLVLAFALTGCASILERSYSSTTPHVDRPTTAGDPSVLRVENYRELVSAVLFLVSQGEEEGVIQLQDYTGEVEADLTAACLEVATEDPLGAYAVEYIKHETTRVVSYDQATLSIHYRRSPEQIRSISTVTGASAIRTELQSALENFETEAVLRVAYFSEDIESINELIRQAYYDTPAAALGMPETQITLYPDSGSQRVVEILLTYPESGEELRRKSEELNQKISQLTLPDSGDAGRPADVQASAAAGVAERLGETAVYSREGGTTAYAAIVEGTANDEGMALAYGLLCSRIGLACETVEGSRNGEPWFWNAVTLSDGEVVYLDPTQGILSDAGDMVQQGYRWSGAEEPAAADR